MAKIVLWIVVFFGAMLVVRMLNVAKAKQRRQADARKRSSEGETMVRCRNCGVFLPREEATAVTDGHVCGDRVCKNRSRP